VTPRAKRGLPTRRRRRPPTQALNDIAPDAVNPGDRYAALRLKRFDPTGNSVIDATSEKLAAIFASVIEATPPGAGMTPTQYGTFIHLKFADAVRSARIFGIGYGDVETTFPEGSPYGSPDSIRTDVVLRDIEGKIVAIYDVKTGAAGLTPARANKLRTKTGAGANTPVIEIRVEGILLKIQMVSGLVS
jgi:hypothetical protein